MKKNYWLVKTEPGVYSVDDLKRDGVTCWDGVRNYQARNFIRDQMKPGDLAFFYHSNAEPSGIAGIAKIVKGAYPDPTQFDSRDSHYDSQATRERPIWYGVDVAFAEKFSMLISLEMLRGTRGLEKMLLLRRGQRLSVQPVSPKEWDLILKLNP